MKSLLLVIAILLSIAFTTTEGEYHPDRSPTTTIETPKVVTISKLDLLYLAVRHTESNNGTIVRTPESIAEGAEGDLQIHKSTVDYCNDYLGCNYTYEDRLDSAKSRQIFYKIQNQFNKKHNLALGMHIWNAGPNKIKKRWNATESYRADCFAYISELKHKHNFKIII